MTLREAIAAAERTAGSGRALALLLNISPATLCRWKSGQTAPRWDLFLRMCAVAGVNPRAVVVPADRG